MTNSKTPKNRTDALIPATPASVPAIKKDAPLAFADQALPPLCTKDAAPLDFSESDFEEDLQEGASLEDFTGEEEILADDPELEPHDLDATRLDALVERNEAALPAVSGRGLTDGLHAYLKEISKFPMLKPGEDVELARRVQQFNDSNAAFRLVSSHLRLVVKIAMDFQRRWMQNVLDLIQEGNVGLLRAANKFDPEKGINFSYYAAFWIKAYILKFIMDNWRLVKIGTTQAQRKLFYNLNKERQRLSAQGFDPDTSTLARNLNVPEPQIIEMTQRMDGADLSLDAPLSDDSGNGAGSTRMDFLPALSTGTEEDFANNERDKLIRESLNSLLPELSAKELDILYSRLLTDAPVTLREIGEKYSISRERVRQLEARLLVKINNHLAKVNPDFSADWISH